jgi:hypothetical protein
LAFRICLYIGGGVNAFDFTHALLRMDFSSAIHKGGSGAFDLTPF